MSDSLNRREFLQTAAALTTAVAVTPSLAAQAVKPAALPYPENGTLIPDEGWRLYLDRQAKWQDDDIFLPEGISWINGELCGSGHPLPVNPPTAGWTTFDHDPGKVVTLPTTVEQHFWGVAGTRPYTSEEYRYAVPATGPAAPADDNIPQNGAYIGVSWWHRPIHIPAEMRGQRIFLHIRGARLRAEVYLNRKLVGYSIMEELPFECDLTHAANPGGLNTLAIRLTNPFGRYDWVDGLNAKWGHVSLYRSHGFAGLDRGMSISAQSTTVRITDAMGSEHADPGESSHITVRLYQESRSVTDDMIQRSVRVKFDRDRNQNAKGSSCRRKHFGCQVFEADGCRQWHRLPPKASKWTRR